MEIKKELSSSYLARVVGLVLWSKSVTSVMGQSLGTVGAEVTHLLRRCSATLATCLRCLRCLRCGHLLCELFILSAIDLPCFELAYAYGHSVAAWLHLAFCVRVATS